MADLERRRHPLDFRPDLPNFGRFTEPSKPLTLALAARKRQLEGRGTSIDKVPLAQ